MKTQVQSKWTDVNYDVANKIWKGMAHKSLSDLYTQRFILPNDPALGRLAGEVVESKTHCLNLSENGIAARLVAYNDAKGIYQPDLTRIIRPNEIAIGIKHHQPCPGKNTEISSNSIKNMVEIIKFQATHITIAVGIEATMPNGTITPGVITLNNPQDYPETNLNEIGLFGPCEYPTTWVKPEFPNNMPTHKVKAYIDNIRTWLAILNTVTVFPEHSYNGSDPLGATTPEAIRYFASLALRAIAGDTEATKALNQKEHLVYCAELAYLALNIGTQFPLNKSTIKSLGVNPGIIHREITTKAFLSYNKNSKVKLVTLTLATANLLPIHDEPSANIHPVNPCKTAPFGKKYLAIQPQTVFNIVENFLARQFNRTELIIDMGEAHAAKIQAWALHTITPAILLALEENQLHNTNCNILEHTLKNLEIKLGQVYGDTNSSPETAHRALLLAIKPEQETLRSITGPRGNGVGAFCTPANFLLETENRMKQQETNGYLDFTVLAFSLHESMLISAV
ncbi:MAG: hypothetical protein GXP08_04435 [Gammaproteobacteria bacterium]|nr:hypothetical protein [Gammaproteobacteria bacterium]